VFGSVERKTGKYFLIPVGLRDKETLLAIGAGANLRGAKGA